MQKRTGLALFAGLAILVAACSGSTASTAPSAEAPSVAPSVAPSEAASVAPSVEPSAALTPIKVGVVTDVGQLEDKSFNQSSNEASKAAAEASGGSHDVIVTQSIADYGANIQTFIDNDFDVIVTVGFLIGTDTAKAAKAHPDIKFIGVDQGICVDADAATRTRPSRAMVMRRPCCRTTRASSSPRPSPATWPASSPPASPRQA